eukprot:CAMPEP_0175091846 /NCGR_PEP_ID=MMETSP0086_2-20121207/2130_1 /TAXON_ID=136419 /ORGANISM="Unknown Unknown, Strain D1" /LENGTH=74 /DNA_ID=CAMNT_0016364635 /DNA_START=485 /DNA_END=706 /DNA_ORIENTATION=-
MELELSPFHAQLHKLLDLRRSEGVAQRVARLDVYNQPVTAEVYFAFAPANVELIWNDPNLSCVGLIRPVRRGPV